MAASPCPSLRDLVLCTALCVSLNACTTVPTANRHADPLGKALSNAESLHAARTPPGVPPPSASHQATEAVVSAWQKQAGGFRTGTPVVVQDGGQTYRITASAPADLKIDELVAVVPLEKRKLAQPVIRPGLGTPFIAHWISTEERRKANPFLSEAGYIYPVTVTLDFAPSTPAGREVRLAVHDVRHADTVLISGKRQPLAADFSAPGEWILQTAAANKDLGMSGFGAMRNSARYLDKMGLFGLEPPSADRIPVIFVHGLMSRPLTWQNAFNELTADPVIRKKYQIFFFRYPSGVPVAFSAKHLRVELAGLHDELHRVGNDKAADHMVLIGHSMDGLLSKMQIVRSGDRLWMNILGDKPENLKLTPEEREAFKPYLEFEPNSHVDRVIFVCTPHQGSKMAQGLAGAIGRGVISLPGRILGTTFDIIQGESLDNPMMKQFLDKGIPSSIENLNPESRFVKTSTQLELKPGLHIHSIVGNRDGRPLTDPKCSDGVVPYTSAHLPNVESELVVNADHGAHAKAEAIAEIRRILLLHLKTISYR